MEISEDFFIVATHPYNFSWTYSNATTNTELFHFKIKDNFITNLEESLYLKVVNKNIEFTPKKEEATRIALEKTKIATNFRIKVGKDYIRHKNYILYCESDNCSELFLKDSTWIFIDNKINPDHTFVIARYNEDINWTRYLQGKVIIYNKGKDDLDLKNFRDNVELKKLDNVGREGHTYLYHIIENYDTINDRVTFLQGDPFVHSPFLLELCCMVTDFDNVQTLSLWYKGGHRERYTPGKHIVYKHMKKMRGAPYASYTMDENGFFVDWKDGFWSKVCKSFGKNPILDFYERCGLAKKFHTRFEMSIGALFSADKTSILKVTQEEYKTVIKELLSKDSQGGYEVYILERIWYDFFKN